MMQIKIFEDSQNSIRFLITGISAEFSNTLRRIAMSELPSMTIDDVFFYENTSVVNDETVAHRLGLIPLKTDLKTYVLPERCTCKSEMGCSRCKVPGSLDVTADGTKRTVYTKDLKFEDPDIAPVSDEIPITKLDKDQKIKIEVNAKLGIGKIHAKWNPVPTCVYKNVPIINITAKKCDSCKKCVQVCHKHILQLKKEKLTVTDPYACSLCMECVKICPPKCSAIKVEMDPQKFIFTVETNGSLSAKTVLSEAAEILKTKTDELNKEIKGLKKT